MDVSTFVDTECTESAAGGPFQVIERLRLSARRALGAGARAAGRDVERDSWLTGVQVLGQWSGAESDP